MALQAVVNPGDEVIVIAPYFPEYKVWIEHAGAVCVEVLADEKTFQIDAERLSAAITSRKAVIVNSPNNPVGAVYTRNPHGTCGCFACAEPSWESTSTSFPMSRIEKLCTEALRFLGYLGYMTAQSCVTLSQSLSLPGERIGWVLIPPTNPEHDDLYAASAGAARALGFVCAPSLFQLD